MSRPLRRVVLVDEHDLFRAGVRTGLEQTVEVVGEAGSVAEAVPLIKELDPDVVLLDVHLPDGGGHAVIMQVAQQRPGVKFLALSVSDAAEDVIVVIRAGARGYVTKAISGATCMITACPPPSGRWTSRRTTSGSSSLISGTASATEPASPTTSTVC